MNRPTMRQEDWDALFEVAFNEWVEEFDAEIRSRLERSFAWSLLDQVFERAFTEDRRQRLVLYGQPACYTNPDLNADELVPNVVHGGLSILSDTDFAHLMLSDCLPPMVSHKLADEFPSEAWRPIFQEVGKFLYQEHLPRRVTS